MHRHLGRFGTSFRLGDLRYQCHFITFLTSTSPVKQQSEDQVLKTTRLHYESTALVHYEMIAKMLLY